MDPDPLPDTTRSFRQDNLSGTPTSPAQYAELDPERLYATSDDTRHNSSMHCLILSCDHALVDFLNVASVPPESSLWIPMPLRTWFWVTYICVLVTGAIALEVALHYSHKNGGMSVILAIDNDTRMLVLEQGGQLRGMRIRVSCTTYTYVGVRTNNATYLPVVCTFRLSLRLALP